LSAPAFCGSFSRTNKLTCCTAVMGGLAIYEV
jgi:hypothetical protein